MSKNTRTNRRNQNTSSVSTGRRLAERHSGTEAELLRDLGFTPGTLRGCSWGIRALIGGPSPEKLARRANFRSMHGRQKLLNRAVQQLSGVIGTLPYNLAWHMPTAEWAEGTEARADAIAETARFAGWIEAVAACPERHRQLVRLLTKLFNPRGIGSPRNQVHPSELLQLSRAHSPGRANALVGKVIRRADQILSPYGMRVSNRAVLEVLLQGGVRVGKLAHRAAELTARRVLNTLGVQLRELASGRVQVITGYTRWQPTVGSREILGIISTGLELLRGHAPFRQLDSARQQWAADRLAAGEFVSFRDAVSAVGRLVADSTDGVCGLADQTLSRNRRGISICPVWIEETVTDRRRSSRRATVVWLVTAGARTFHARVGDWRDALAHARQAWERQEAAARTEADLESLLTGRDLRISVLIRREDSYQAGNCRPGTEAWIRSAGIDPNRLTLPLHVVWSHAVQRGESRAQNACRVAARQALQLL